jgi:isocitrate dehydrogenase (NAD+)
MILLQVPIEWEEVSVTPILKGGRTVIPESAIASVRKNTIALKGGRTDEVAYMWSN